MALSLMFDGDIELNSDISEDDGYQFQLVSTYNRGTPIPVEVTLASFLRDGSIVAHDGYQNREMTLQIRVTAPDTAALAAGEKRLKLATEKRTTLSWTTHDEIGATTVFEVLTSNLIEPDANDLAEIHNQRTYGLRLICLPFGRSVDLITDDAGTPPSTGGTLLYAADTTTGWAKVSGSGTYTADTSIKTEGVASVRTVRDSSTYNDSLGGYNTYTSRDRVTGLSLSTGSGGYFSVAVRWAYNNLEYGPCGLLQVFVTTAAGEVQVTDFMAVSQDANGFTRYVWPVDGSLTITGLRFVVRQRASGYSDASSAFVWYDNFELLPAATTDHQIVKQLDVQGSARTTGALHIAAPTEVVALGHVLAITAPTDELPDGFLPDGRRWVVQGDTTVDATALWGSYYTPDPTDYSDATGATDRPIFDVPVGMLTPGPYTIVALVKAEASPTISGVQAQLRIGATNTGPVSAAEVSLPNLTAGWQFVTVGTVFLPPLPMQSADATAKVRLLFKGAKLADVYMIPAWQVGGRAVADFSIVNCGTGTPAAGGSSSNLWIDSPSTMQPRGGLWRGPTLDRTNTQSAWPDTKHRGQHAFKPGLLSAFLVSTGAAGPTLTLEYHPAWFGNAAS